MPCHLERFDGLKTEPLSSAAVSVANDEADDEEEMTTTMVRERTPFVVFCALRQHFLGRRWRPTRREPLRPHASV